MTDPVPLAAVTGDASEYGGKAVALARLIGAGHTVPAGFVLPASVYRHFVDVTGVRGRVVLELARKELSEMRWEEMWDAALRVRHLFTSTPLPETLAEPVRRALATLRPPYVVRSSSPHEDSASSSFAGVHASFVGARTPEQVLRDVLAVWSSLFSDAALLYRRELGLDPMESAMAVVVQRLRAGDASGVAFSHNPVDPAEGIVEAAHGLNQGVVDGAVAIDRWFVRRADGELRHEPAVRDRRAVLGPGGVVVEELPPALCARPPLDPEHVVELWGTVRAIEDLFGGPQDVEWTRAGGDLVVLQARPITTGAADDSDPTRAWYLTLRRSRDNLEALRGRIEDELLPAMERAADAIAGDVTELADDELLAATEERRGLHQHWLDVYWRDFIPFAHGMRLFGEFYNRTVRAQDPYAFVELLAGSGLRAVERNQRLRVLGSAADAEVAALLDELGGRFAPNAENIAGFRRLAGAIADAPERGARDRDALTAAFLDNYAGDDRRLAAQLLDLGRASYRLRDDDNIVLGRLEAAWHAAHDEAARRGLLEPRVSRPPTPRADEHARLEPSSTGSADESVRGRQLVGQPAGPGWARGPARVVTSRSDLFAFERGEVLVCDAVDPNMTFVAPLASAIVERRGGMLIHGAIIAREYGIPCVTGVPRVTDLLRTGDPLTVDGYLGLVIAQRDDIGETT